MLKRLFRTDNSEEARTAATRRQQKELQRRIFLNTMRTVYPDSLQIKYEYLIDEARYALTPLSVTEKCKNISDKVWSDCMGKLNKIFVIHVAVRNRLLATFWLTWTVSACLYISFGTTLRLQSPWFLTLGPLFIILSVIFVPNLLFTMFAMKPLLKQFDQWKTDFVLQMDKQGVEVVKITSGELVNDKSAYHLVGTLFFGSTVWFTFKDAQVEIFWRSVKTGKHVRRYSLMITTGTPLAAGNNNSNDAQVADGDAAVTATTPRETAKLVPIGDDDEEQ